MNIHNIPFLNIKKKIILNYPKSATKELVPRDSRTMFEPAVVNEPSVFEPLKFYCTSFWMATLVRKANRRSQKLFPLVKMAENTWRCNLST